MSASWSTSSTGSSFSCSRCRWTLTQRLVFPASSSWGSSSSAGSKPTELSALDLGNGKLPCVSVRAGSDNNDAEVPVGEDKWLRSGSDRISSWSENSGSEIIQLKKYHWLWCFFYRFFNWFMIWIRIRQTTTVTEPPTRDSCSNDCLSTCLNCLGRNLSSRLCFKGCLWQLFRKKWVLRDIRCYLLISVLRIRISDNGHVLV